MTFHSSVRLYKGFGKNRVGGFGYVVEREWFGKRGMEVG